jgi:shikimate kinase
VTSALGEQGAEPARGVLALGSGAVLDEGVRQLLAGQPVVYLSTSFGTVVRRIGLDRPRVVVPGNPRGRLRAMLTERLPLYQRLAAVTVETDDLDPDEIAAQIAATVTAGPSQSPEPLQSPPEDSR